MTDDHSAARDVIRNAYARVNYGSQKRPISKLAVQHIENMADYIIAALTAAGYEIVQRGDGVRVSINRDRIGYDEGFNAFKRFVLEEYRPDWEPGDWQIIAEAVWSAINAAIAAGGES